MPIARNGDVGFHYERTGTGPPVLLVMGLGMTATGWWRTVPVLADRFEVIAFDNRGVGRSDRPEGPYAADDMADDAAAVLDAAGHESAHVYGISLGGMIAQIVALRHPRRVRSLVLGATTPGGEHGVPADPPTLAFFQRRAEMTAEEAVWASVPFNYGPSTRRDQAGRVGEDIVQRLRFPIEPDPYRAQLAAALGHDAHDRLDEIEVPTLIVHGEEDRIVPAANARVLAARIAGARLELWPGAGHLYFTDEPRADEGVKRFLLEAEQKYSMLAR